VDNSSFNKVFYDRYNGAYLTQKDWADILSRIPSKGFYLHAFSDIRVLGVSVGPVAFVSGGEVASNLRFAKDFFVILQGNLPGRTYRFDSSRGEAWALSRFQVSGALPIPLRGPQILTTGLTLKYLRGFGYLRTLEVRGDFTTEFEAVGEAFVRMQVAQGGSGFAVDWGVAAIIDRWTVGLCLENLLSSIKWTKEPRIMEFTFRTLEPITIEKIQGDSLDAYVEKDKQENVIGAFRTSLPAVLRLGVSTSQGPFLLAFDYHQGFSERPGVSSRPLVALGVEYQRWGGFLPRMGLSLGGVYGLALGMGFGFRLGVWQLDFGLRMHRGLWPTYAKGLTLALSTRFAF